MVLVRLEFVFADALFRRSLGSVTAHFSNTICWCFSTAVSNIGYHIVTMLQGARHNEQIHQGCYDRAFLALFFRFVNCLSNFDSYLNFFFFFLGRSFLPFLSAAA